MNPRTCSVQHRQRLQSFNMSNHGMDMCVRLVKFHFVAESRKALAAVGWHQAAFRILNSSGNRAHFSQSNPYNHACIREVAIINSYQVTIILWGAVWVLGFASAPIGQGIRPPPLEREEADPHTPPSSAPFGLGTRRGRVPDTRQKL